MGFPPVAAFADKQSTGLFGVSHKLLAQFSPYFKSHPFTKQKRVYPKRVNSFLELEMGFPPVAAFADKQSTGLFGVSHKLLAQFSP